MRLFEINKIGMFLDSLTHGTETRKGDEVKIVTLTLRVQPFDAAHASAIEAAVRNTLFRIAAVEAHPHLKRVEFRLGCPRQFFEVYATPDTVDRAIGFDQVRIGQTYARTEKDVNGYAFVIKASFGPVSKDELEYLEAWRLGQRFVTTQPAEAGLFPDDEDEHEPEETTRPTPMFDDEDKVGMARG